MRRLLLATLALFAVSGPAFAYEQWIESPVTLTLTLSQTGEEQTKPGNGGTETVSAPLRHSRFGNAEVLAAMVSAGLIPETRGWSLVVIWAGDADHPAYAGSYRFYARRGKGASALKAAVPSSLLAFQRNSDALGGQHRTAGDETILSGSENFEVYGRLSFETAAVTGEVGGLLTGTGRYKNGRYLPGATKGVLQGIQHAQGSENFGVAKGSITLGEAKIVDTTPPPPRNTGGYGTPGPTIPDVDGGIAVSVN